MLEVHAIVHTGIVHKAFYPSIVTYGFLHRALAGIGPRQFGDNLKTFSIYLLQRSAIVIFISSNDDGQGTFAREHFKGDEAKAKEFVAQLYKNVPVLDTGARGSTTTFVKRGIGDVFLSWENEAFLALNELGPDKFDIIVPSISVKAEPPVALVDKNAEKHGTTEVAKAYLEYLYSDAGQKIAAKHYYRPFKPELADPNDLKRFTKVKLVTIEDFGGWKAAQPKFFGDGGVFDSIYKPGGK